MLSGLSKVSGIVPENPVFSTRLRYHSGIFKNFEIFNIIEFRRYVVPFSIKFCEHCRKIATFFKGSLFQLGET